MPNQAKTTLSDDVVKQISQLLGREPRGLEDVAVRAPSGEPMVIRVASLVDNAPFPNLFWLVDPGIVYRIDGDEAGGLIQRLQKIVDADAEIQASLVDDHRAHITLRNRYMTAAVEENLRSELRQKLDDIGEEYGVPESHRHFLSGTPAREVRRFAEENKTDLIVLGTHGQKGVQLLLGATANSVLHGSSCDVLAVRVFDAE